MADDQQPFSNILSDKFPMPKGLKAPDGAFGATTSASVLAEIEKEVLGHAERMGKLLSTFKALRLKETETFDKAMQGLANIAQMRGD